LIFAVYEPIFVNFCEGKKKRPHPNPSPKERVLEDERIAFDNFYA
jgi:hypothetical protein